MQEVNKTCENRGSSSLLAEFSFLFAFAGLREFGKRDLCHGSKLTLIHQPPSTTSDGTLQTACSNDTFANCDLSPLCPAHSFTVIPLLLSEPTQHEVSREDSVAE